MVVVAYGLILPKAVLRCPSFGLFECAWFYSSTLARYSYPFNVQFGLAMLQTGVTIIQMDEGLDTGDMLHKVYCDILPTETSTSLYN